MTALSLCSGIGALDMAIQAIGVQTIGYCEYDPWCGEILQHRMASGHLDSAPIWRDLKTLDGHGLPAGVDLIYGGIPCQPHSQAGKRLQADDPRDLWPATRRLLHELRPRLFFLENVAGFATRNGTNPAFAYNVISDLAGMGYMGRAGIVKASDAGAPHSRARWFCLATLDGDVSMADTGYGKHRGWTATREAGSEHEGTTGAHEAGSRRGTSAGRFWQVNEPSDGRPSDNELAGAGLEYPEQFLTETTEGSSLRRQGRILSITGWAQAYDRYPSTSGALDNADSHRRTQGWSGYGSADEPPHATTERDGFKSLPFPPNRLDSAAWAAVIEQHPEYAPALEPHLRGMVDGHPVELDKDRRKRLAALGNAVVPAQVLLALEHLLEVGA